MRIAVSLFALILSCILMTFAVAQSGESLNEQGINLSHKKDYKSAEQHFLKASELNYPDAFYNLALLEINGYLRKKNVSKAVEYYSKAAELNHSTAQYELSVIYNDPEFGLENNKQYLFWLKKAANNNHNIAMHNLATIAIKANKTDLAIKYFKKSADNGYLPSILSISQIYYYGIGTKKDYKASNDYYKKAASKGDSEALFVLGIMSERGLGSKKDLDQALKYYNAAFHFGSKKAEFNLAVLKYEKGLKKEGIILLNKLAKAGNKKAMEYIKSIKISIPNVKISQSKTPKKEK